ncbi:MAG TPA: hypothetical protein VNW29_03015 [Candidatus Sulfotelmatobacter sp.]|jgi:hypothetical protein|nr:hypothetical protein [Candidatus Sulfotelmatobacter sp.]
MDTIQFSEAELQLIQGLKLGEKITRLVTLVEELDTENGLLQSEVKILK